MLKNIFNFSKKDKIGVVVLALIILTLIVLLNVGGRTFMPNPFQSESADSIKTKFKKEKLSNKKQSNQSYAKRDKKKKKDPVLHNFDPNSLNKEGWIKFGFSPKQAGAITNYLNQFGPIEFKEQLKKVYVIDEYKYNQLEPYIELPGAESGDTNSVFEKIEINSANINEFKSIKGIGDYYATAILNARTKTGGFVDFKMFKSFTNFPNEIDSLLKSKCTISPNLIEKIDINTASKKELRKIPHVNWELTALILEERSKRKINSLDFLPDSVVNPLDKTSLIYYFKF